MSSDLTVYCLPVSGGGFVAQLGLLSEVYEARRHLVGKLWGRRDYEPDLVLAASGGNVATYVALAGDWSPDGIRRVVTRVTTPMFMRSWFPSWLPFLPTWLIGVFFGSMYRAGYGSCELFKALFTPSLITRTEIWTGTYDHTHLKAQFFCNRSQDQALINGADPSLTTLFGCMPLRYLGGDVCRLATVSTASASIPGMVTRQNLDGTTYADGGVMYASPLSVLNREITRLLQPEVKAPGTILLPTEPEVKIPPTGGRRLRLFYFSPYQAEFPKTISLGSSTLTTDFRQVLHANMLQDRAAAINILLSLAPPEAIVIEDHPEMTAVDLAALLKRLENSQHYVIVLYPHGAPSVNLRHLTPNVMWRQIENTRKKWGCTVWAIPSSD